MEYICSECNKQCKSKKSLTSHTWKVHNENGKLHKPRLGAIVSNETKTRISKTLTGRTFPGRGNGWSGKTHTENTKEKLSKIMSERHKNGTAHNIGASRWNNTPSYPEKFFMSVIANEFQDKDYKREVPFGKFSLDFVWEHKKKVIEIDGEQHERFEEQKKRDLEKNQLLFDSGYELLRIKWKDLFTAPKAWITVAKEFIDS